MKQKLPYVLLALFLLGAPFYPFASGVPQPVHYLLLLILPLVVARTEKHRLSSNYEPMLVLLFLFVGYAVVINVTFAMIHADAQPLFGSAYLAYDAVLFTVLLAIASWDRIRFIRTIYLGVCLTLGLQTLLALIGLGSQGARATLFFNNPNQLGYFALLCGTIIALVARVSPIPVVQRTLLYGSVVFLAAISLSKAAIIACVILITIDYLQASAPRKSVLALLILFNVLFASVVELNVGRIIEDNQLYAKVWKRMSTTGQQSDDNLSGRHYDRIVRYPNFLVLGAGEGLFDRFDRGGEIHATLPSILFCYGIVGFGLFLGFLGWVFVLGRRAATALCLPVFFYGLTHNGIRQTVFWLLLCLVVVVGQRTFPLVVRHDEDRRPRA